MPTILLIEDNEMNRDMLSRRLSRRGYKVLLAEDGEAGLRMARSFEPHLILMDVNLPDVDGLEVTRRLKAASETRHIPIIVLTAHAMTGDRQRALSAGGDDYDIKPVELDRLIAKIQLQLQRVSS
jgi:CheY-like chemotaxis protein